MADGDTPRALPDHELAAVDAVVDAWVRRQLEEVDVVAHVERIEQRWFVRLRGEAKDVFTVWFELRQRTLHYETYVIPSPPTRRDEVFEYALRANAELYGAAFAIGEEDAVFLRGQLPADQVDDAELDRILGSIYAWVERYFPTLARLAFSF